MNISFSFELCALFEKSWWLHVTDLPSRLIAMVMTFRSFFCGRSRVSAVTETVSSKNGGTFNHPGNTQTQEMYP